jgi:hypothetical protein
VPAAGRADRKQTHLQVEPALLAQQRQLHVRARSLGRLGRELRLPEVQRALHRKAQPEAFTNENTVSDSESVTAAAVSPSVWGVEGTGARSALSGPVPCLQGVDQRLALLCELPELLHLRAPHGAVRTHGSRAPRRAPMRQCSALLLRDARVTLHGAFASRWMACSLLRRAATHSLRHTCVCVRARACVCVCVCVCVCTACLSVGASAHCTGVRCMLCAVHACTQRPKVRRPREQSFPAGTMSGVASGDVGCSKWKWWMLQVKLLDVASGNGGCCK